MGQERDIYPVGAVSGGKSRCSTDDARLSVPVVVQIHKEVLSR